MARIASATGVPCATRTSTWRSLEMISSGVCLFLPIVILLRLRSHTSGWTTPTGADHIDTGQYSRVLTSVDGRRMMSDENVSQTDEILVQGHATPAQVQDNLVEALLPLLTPLYERFDFFRLPVQLVEEETLRLR